MCSRGGLTRWRLGRGLVAKDGGGGGRGEGTSCCCVVENSATATGWGSEVKEFHIKKEKTVGPNVPALDCRPVWHLTRMANRNSL